MAQRSRLIQVSSETIELTESLPPSSAGSGFFLYGEIAVRHFGASTHSIVIKIKASNPRSYVVFPSSMCLRPGEQDIFKFTYKKQHSATGLPPLKNTFTHQSFSKSSSSGSGGGRTREQSKDNSEDLTSDRFLVIAIELDDTAYVENRFRVREQDLFSSDRLKLQQRITLNVKHNHQSNVVFHQPPLKQVAAVGGGGSSIRNNSSPVISFRVPAIKITNSSSNNNNNLTVIRPSSDLGNEIQEQSMHSQQPSSQHSRLDSPSRNSPDQSSDIRNKGASNTQKELTKVRVVGRQTAEESASDNEFKVLYERLVQKVLEFEKRNQKLDTEIKQAEVFKKSLVKMKEQTVSFSLGGRAGEASGRALNKLDHSIFQLLAMLLSAMIVGALFAS